MNLSRSEIKRILPIARRRIATKLIAFVQRLLLKEKLVKNVFGTDSTKRVLLCHLPEALTGKQLPKHHSNLTECSIIARCFHRLGYSVDCSSRANTNIDYAPYDVVFGISGNAFLGSFTGNANINPLRIFYSVGAQMKFNYDMTVRKNRDFFDRHKRWFLNSCRYIPGSGINYYESHFADAVICLGDEYVLEQFKNSDDRKERYRFMPAFYFSAVTPDKNKDFALCRRNILWFGSAGLLHKGLDIAVDFVLSHPEFTLHICGSSSGEKDFLDYYMPKIKNSKNIFVHGFVNIESQEYEQVLGQCGILLSPSISEGGAVSALNVLGNGALLPVYSRATGIDLEKVGVVVDDITYNRFEEALLVADALSVDEFAAKAWAAHRLVRDNYTIQKYEERMYNHIRSIIEENE